MHGLGRYSKAHVKYCTQLSTCDQTYIGLKESTKGERDRKGKKRRRLKPRKNYTKRKRQLKRERKSQKDKQSA